MYRRKRLGLGALLAAGLSALVLGIVAVAGASAATSTLGLTTEPSGSTALGCSSSLVGQQTDSPTTPYLVPASGAGTAVQSWSSAVSGDTPGDTLTLWVLAPASSTTYTVVGTDAEKIPNPLPSGGIATFTPTTPIQVQPGDTFALTSSSTFDVCYWHGGSTPTGDGLFGVTPSPTTSTVGETVTSTASSGGTFALDLGVTLAASVEDASVSASAQPTSITAGSLGLFTNTVANAGPGTGPITLTDTVPAGLAIDAASVVGGTCTVAGQVVTCITASLASGATVPVYVVVTSSGTGTYTNPASVAVPSSMTDPTSANNASSATLTVTPAPVATTSTVTLTTPAPQVCTVVSLKGIPQAFAKTVLKALHCKVGKVKKTMSKTVAKGDVIATTPGKGTFAAGRSISLKVSSGKPKPKRRKK